MRRHLLCPLPSFPETPSTGHLFADLDRSCHSSRNCRLRPALGDPSSAWANPLHVRGSVRHGADASLSTPATAGTAAGGQDHGLEARVSAMALVATSGLVEATRMLEVSLELGNACRERVRWSLRVADLTPSQLTEHLWPCRSSAAVAALGSDPLGTTRLKRRRMIERVWVDVDRAIDRVSWPPAMKELRFGYHFNRPLERVKLPDGVQVMSFGNRFNQARCKRRPLQRLMSLQHVLIVFKYRETARQKLPGFRAGRAWVHRGPTHSVGVLRIITFSVEGDWHGT